MILLHEPTPRDQPRLHKYYMHAHTHTRARTHTHTHKHSRCATHPHTHIVSHIHSVTHTYTSYVQALSCRKRDNSMTFNPRHAGEATSLTVMGICTAGEAATNPRMHTDTHIRTGLFRPAYCLVAVWFILVSFILSIHCTTWLVYFCIGAVASIILYLLLWWARPSIMRPGGFLSFLIYQKLGTATKWGAIDFSMFGRSVPIVSSFRINAFNITTYIYTYIHTYIHICIYTYTHIHIYTH
jgi:hypothetical protein